jgi:hypothetical protein
MDRRDRRAIWICFIAALVAGDEADGRAGTRALIWH